MTSKSFRVLASRSFKSLATVSSKVFGLNFVTVSVSSLGAGVKRQSLRRCRHCGVGGLFLQARLQPDLGDDGGERHDTRHDVEDRANGVREVEAYVAGYRAGTAALGLGDLGRDECGLL